MNFEEVVFKITKTMSRYYSSIKFLLILLTVFGLITLFVILFDVQQDLYYPPAEDPSSVHTTKVTQKNEEIENNLWLEYRKNWNGEILIELSKASIKFTEEYKIRMTSKGLHPLSQQHERFYKRIEIMERYCSSFLTSVDKGTYNIRTGSYAVLFNDRVQLLQCEVQKVGSSTWTYVFENLVDEKNTYHESVPYGNRNWKKFSLVYNLHNTTLVAKRYQTYTKFLFSRNPFERLVSAYTSKFTTNDKNFEKYLSPMIIRQNYLANVKSEVIEGIRKKLKTGINSINKFKLDEKLIQQIKRLDVGPGNFNISFVEFLTYIITVSKKHGRKALNYHWAPVTIICDPCTIKYDILGKFETLYEDSQEILNYVQGKDSRVTVEFPKGEPRIKTDSCNEAFSHIPLNMRNDLYELYKEDFILFDYKYNGKNSDDKFC